MQLVEGFSQAFVSYPDLDPAAIEHAPDYYRFATEEQGQAVTARSVAARIDFADRAELAAAIADYPEHGAVLDWRGFVSVRRAGEYTFFVHSDDGAHTLARRNAAGEQRGRARCGDAAGHARPAARGSTRSARTSLQATAATRCACRTRAPTRTGQQVVLTVYHFGTAEEPADAVMGPEALLEDGFMETFVRFPGMDGPAIEHVPDYYRYATAEQGPRARDGARGGRDDRLP